MFLVIIIGNIIFFSVCMYMSGQRTDFHFEWQLLNIIEVSFDRSTSVLKGFPLNSRPARLHCTTLHARFFSGGFVAF